MSVSQSIIPYTILLPSSCLHPFLWWIRKTCRGLKMLISFVEFNLLTPQNSTFPSTAGPRFHRLTSWSRELRGFSSTSISPVWLPQWSIGGRWDLVQTGRNGAAETCDVTGTRVSPELFQTQGITGVAQWNYQRLLDLKQPGVCLPANFDLALIANINAVSESVLGTV